jgi:hypothetical protein
MMISKACIVQSYLPTKRMPNSIIYKVFRSYLNSFVATPHLFASRTCLFHPIFISKDMLTDFFPLCPHVRFRSPSPRRLDKYYMLVRRFLNGTLRLLQRDGWEPASIEAYNQILIKATGGPLSFVLRPSFALFSLARSWFLESTGSSLSRLWRVLRMMISKACIVQS